MISRLIFSISVFATIYYLPIVIFKGVRGHEMNWSTLFPFALGVTGMVLFFCGIY